MRTEPFVSVIVPIYNAAPYITECVESVLSEETEGIEILLLDDGSTDNSEQVCRELAENSPKVTYYKLMHGGVSVTRNIGLDKAQGKYVFFLDADDRIERGLIDKLLLKMEKHGAVMGNSFLKEFGISSKTHFSLNREVREVTENDETLELFISGTGSLMAIGGKMMDRVQIGNDRFRTDLPSGEDTCFIYDYLLKGGKTVFEYDTFYGYRMHQSNTISRPHARNFESVMKVNRYLYEKEAERVGMEKAMNILLRRADMLRIWMERCPENEAKGELREAIINCMKELKDDVVYPYVPWRFKIRAFIFQYFWAIYKLLFSGKSQPAPRCCGCGACKDACPVGAIEMKLGKDGFTYPEFHEAECINCGRCDAVCSYKQNYDINVVNRYYALQAEDNAIREVSTSGGAFRLLAEATIKSGGVVVGAIMDKLIVRHTMIETVDELYRMQGTKYVQSNIYGIFKEVKRILDEGRKVLFSGTPCQVDALNMFLGKDYSNLILVDLICNGVSSPTIWGKYTKYLEQVNKSKLLSYSFRDKRNCDDGHTVAAVFESGEKTWSIYEDKFCLSYFRGISTMKQCSDCLYCTDKRKSDITIGDFWGVEKSHPEIADGMGTSLIIVRTGKGNLLLSEISKQARVFEISERDARQPRLFYPAAMHGNARLAKIAANYMPITLWFKIFVK